MKKFIATIKKLSYVYLLILGGSSIANAAVENFSSVLNNPRIQNHIIERYKNELDRIFLVLLNQSKQDKAFLNYIKGTSDFLAKNSHIKELPNVSNNFELNKVETPQVLSIQNGILFKWRNEELKVIYSNSGELLFNGLRLKKSDLKFPDEQLQSSHQEDYFLPEFLVPKAHAVLPLAAIWSFAAWMIKGTVVSAAAGASVGIVGGCASGFYTNSKPGQDLENCKEGINGALTIAMASVGGALGALYTLNDSKIVGDFPKSEKLSHEQANKLKVSRFSLLKASGILGAVVGVFHLGKEILYMNGAEFFCGDNGRYKAIAQINGTPMDMYDFDGKRIHIKGRLLAIGTDQDDFEKYLISQSVPKEMAKNMAMGLIQEHNTKRQECLNNPNKKIPESKTLIRELMPKPKSNVN